MSIDSKPQLVKRVEALENRYTDVGLNAQTFPVSDAVNDDRPTTTHGAARCHATAACRL